jgi:hypothetical protein
MFMKILNAWVLLFYGPEGDGAPFGDKDTADLNFMASQFVVFTLLLAMLLGLIELGGRLWVALTVIL